jgi:tripartite-type tricarboxylate transporter receptor subunit TctC
MTDSALVLNKGLTAAQSAFWQNALAKSVSTSDWKQQLESNNVSPQLRTGAELVKWLDTEYSATRAVMASLGLVK